MGCAKRLRSQLKPSDRGGLPQHVLPRRERFSRRKGGLAVKLWSVLVSLVVYSLELAWAHKERGPAMSIDVEGETYIIDDTTAIYMEKDKVIFCPIQKCASAEWLRVLLYLDTGDENRLHEGQGFAMYPRNFSTVADLEMENKASLWTAPEVTKFVVLRDPAERLLAVFRNKCYKVNELGEVVPRADILSYSKASGYLGACDAVDSFPEYIPPEMSEEQLQDHKACLPIKAILRVARAVDPLGMFHEYAENHLRAVLENQCDVNNHFRPAYCSCGLGALHDSYVKVPFHDMGSAPDRVFGENYVGASPERKEYLRAQVGNFFITNNEVYGLKVTNTSSEAVRTYFTPELLDLVRAAYEIDYRLFGEYFYTSEEEWGGW